MNNPDFEDLLYALRCSNAVYLQNDDEAMSEFAKLGASVIGRYADYGHQAIVARDPDGRASFTICGTRVSDGTLLERCTDLFNDADCVPEQVAVGQYAATGAVRGLGDVVDWARSLLPPGEPFRVRGHSMGGWRAHLAPICVPDDSLILDITSFEPPRAANDAYYQAHADVFARSVTVINGYDPWAAWPWPPLAQALQHPPHPIMWLRDNWWEWVDRSTWPGGQILHQSAHFPEQVELALLSVLNNLTCEV